MSSSLLIPQTIFLKWESSPVLTKSSKNNCCCYCRVCTLVHWLYCHKFSPFQPENHSNKNPKPSTNVDTTVICIATRPKFCLRTHNLSETTMVKEVCIHVANIIWQETYLEILFTKHTDFIKLSQNYTSTQNIQNFPDQENTVSLLPNWQIWDTNKHLVFFQVLP